MGAESFEQFHLVSQYRNNVEIYVGNRGSFMSVLQTFDVHEGSVKANETTMVDPSFD